MPDAPPDQHHPRNPAYDDPEIEQRGRRSIEGSKAKLVIGALVATAVIVLLLWGLGYLVADTQQGVDAKPADAVIGN